MSAFSDNLRELDARVAELLGWRRVIVPPDVDGHFGGTEVLVPPNHNPNYQWPSKGLIPLTFFVPHYSTDPAACAELDEKMAREGWELMVLRSEGEAIAHYFRKNEIGHSSPFAVTMSPEEIGATEWEARTRAAVAAMEREEKA